MKISQNIPYRIIANCIPVKGFKRSVICDLHRNDIKFIPNDLYNVLSETQGKTIREIKKKYDNLYDDIIDDYFKFLYNEDFIFFTDTPWLFQKMSLNWFSPNKITNAIIDIGTNSNFEINKILNDLNKLYCKHLEIRFYRNVNFSELKDIPAILNNQKSSIMSVDYLLPYNSIFKEDKIYDFFKDNGRIFSMRFYNAKYNKFIPPIEDRRGYIVYTKNKIKSKICCGVVDTGFFIANISNFTESLHHNSCLNRKISIDVDGNIKNCPSMPESYGNIKDTALEEALNKPGFKKYWNITKDQIEVCKDCEFRYVCTDCRAYTERTKFDKDDIDFSKPLKCGYNPYTNEWAEWSTNPLKQKAIEYYGMQDLVKTNV